MLKLSFLDCGATNKKAKQKRTTRVHIDQQKTSTKSRTPITDTFIGKPKRSLPKMIQPKAPEKNKHSKLKLVKSNQQGNAVIEKKQKLKKSKLIAQIDNSQKKKTHSTRNETKLSPQRRTVGKNKKNTALKESKRV